ncbi:hypothetical protein [Streptomyces sp. NPDC058667]|uniref:hypothetical protein n=1 Tax=Streptomyces sp. NPDC058667 TaxID=3346588 RepID=UPI00366848C6
MSTIPPPRPGTTGPANHPFPTAPGSAPGGVRGWLHDRGRDLDIASTHGWPLMATWLRIAAIAGATLAVLLIAYTVGAAALDAGRALPWKFPVDSDPTGLLATIDQPVHRYLDTHTTGLPVSATTVYGTWQAVGALSLIGGYLRFSGARLTWVLWVAATVAMVWSATPGPGRTVAVGITVLAGAALSLLALHGLSLTPTLYVDVHTPTQPAPQVHAEIHLPRTEPETPSYKPFDPQKPSQN